MRPKKILLPLLIITSFFVLGIAVNAQLTSRNENAKDKEMPEVEVTKGLEKENNNKNQIAEKNVEAVKTELEQKFEDRLKIASSSYELKMKTFKLNLGLIKDTVKQQLTEKINTKIDDLNRKFTGKFVEALDKLSAILSRLSDKADAAKTSGKDTLAVEKAITSAQNAIDAAKTAVLAQAGKTYVLQVSSDSTLKLTVGASVSQFERDILTVRKLVIDAKQAVMNVVTELAKIGVGSLKVGQPGEMTSSESATISPTSVVTPTIEPSTTPESTPTGQIEVSPTP